MPRRPLAWRLEGTGDLAPYGAGQVVDVAGRVDWLTPIVSTRLTDVTFNPRWNLPRSIGIQEVLLMARRDPDYLAP